MKKLRNFRKLLKNERGQGMTEYILLLVVVVGLVMIFKKQIQSTLEGKLGSLQQNINSVE